MDLSNHNLQAHLITFFFVCYVRWHELSFQKLSGHYFDLILFKSLLEKKLSVFVYFQTSIPIVYHTFDFSYAENYFLC